AIAVQICRSSGLDDVKIDSLLTLLESRYAGNPSRGRRATDPVAWHSKQYGVVWMAVQPGTLVAGTQWFIQGRQDPVAEVVSPVSLVWHIATSELEHGTVFYTVPTPTHPVVKESLTVAEPITPDATLID